MALPIYLPADQLQPKWATPLNNLLANPLTQGRLITGLALTTGTNVINHKLGHTLVGWMLVGLSASVTIYDTQASNQTPQLTLNLTSSGPATVSLWVF